MGLTFLAWAACGAWIAAIAFGAFALHARRDYKRAERQLNEAAKLGAQLIREHQAIIEMMRRMSVDAFMARHVQIWKEWGALTGLSFKIAVLQERRGGDDDE